MLGFKFLDLPDRKTSAKIDALDPSAMTTAWKLCFICNKNICLQTFKLFLFSI